MAQPKSARGGDGLSSRALKLFGSQGTNRSSRSLGDLGTRTQLLKSLIHGIVGEEFRRVNDV
jgi:hypothetical protein